jgi:hypothetical protein
LSCSILEYQVEERTQDILAQNEETRFRELLTQITQMPLQQQQEISTDELNKFIINTTQRNDILLFGF